MELIRDLFVPAVDAAGTVVDRLLPAEVARSDGRRPPPSFRSKLSAYLAMIPAADFLSDCALFSVLVADGGDHPRVGNGDWRWRIQRLLVADGGDHSLVGHTDWR